ncbi:sugar O-acetyltransferase [Caulobacter sp. 17J65-9]|uniref:sugar O-acetyltransferase n=1 Tax=Caulobacter sp. 17J65-9 TaxID=2709382 RepID=UPI0013C9BBB3|nr:sugar O-acetyltransferase [Caulobacter sp. 17J65-9]NEX94529.1 sugar O-acetyltransferase [Caulobacter sp. 17J65-9]
MPPTEKQKMLAGELYRPDAELAADHARAQRLFSLYNATSEDEPERRRALLHDLLGEVGDGVVIRPPFRCDYGAHIRVGAGTFMNFGCVILDCAEVTIGKLCQLGPGVQIYAADHPRDPALRRELLELARPVRVGDNVWIGGNAILLPGISVGDDAVIGAGAVVTRDVPAGATVVGSPARQASG